MTTIATPSSTSGPASTEPSVAQTWGLVARFANPADLVHAAHEVRKTGYRYWDCHSPFPVHGIDPAMGINRTILPVVVFAAGATGCTLGFLLQAFTNSFGSSIWALVWVTGYPFMISGKPLLSVPAFVPVMFEVTILFSALTAAFGMLAFNQLPELYHPLLKHPGFGRATDDGFFISIEARDPQFLRSKTGEFLKSLGASSVEVVES
ncbi:MAG: DUF3341 domain-containing protein [Phycisphaerae bacterium]|nr:DUF3341 domain-containing protein [Phycisphaerae bacterium]